MSTSLESQLHQVDPPQAPPQDHQWRWGGSGCGLISFSLAKYLSLGSLFSCALTSWSCTINELLALSDGEVLS